MFEHFSVFLLTAPGTLVSVSSLYLVQFRIFQLHWGITSKYISLLFGFVLWTYKLLREMMLWVKEWTAVDDNWICLNNRTIFSNHICWLQHNKRNSATQNLDNNMFVRIVRSLRKFSKSDYFFRHVFRLSVRVEQLSYLWDYVYKRLWDYVYKIWFLVFFNEPARKFKFFKTGQLKCT